MPLNMLDTQLAHLTAIVAVVIIPLLAVFHRQRRFTSKEGYPLPPGPPPPWFWSNVIPTANISSTFIDWAKEYGPVITLRQGSQIVIIIAEVDAATEIMEKEGSALTDRPPMIAVNELLSGCKRITLIGSGERFHQLRKAIHTHFQAKAVETYKDTQFEQARTFILDILDDPKDHQKHTHRYSTSIILHITYGKSGPTSTNDPDFVGVKQAVAHFIEGMRPGAYLVDRFPWLKYVPGYGRRLRRYYESDLKFYRGQLNWVERAMLWNDDAGPSFSRTLSENVDEHQLSINEMSFLARTVFGAGSGTTADAIIAMIMAAACFPDAQARVQEELDTVVGMVRLPSWNNWDALPQLHAFISEALHWRPVTPLGFAHCSTRDIIWVQCLLLGATIHIPAGTTVVGNHWAISRDPVAFPDPEKFDPQRWIDQNGQLRNDVECYPFGFGRRVCPGMHFANRSISITLALVLWSFQIVERSKAPINTTPDRDNVVAHLADFEVKFVPRIEEAQLREMMVM
ncbi:cytochrome P450 [Imleria badia]|nr:cytochrome P450 [Imleria badia]